MSLQRCDSLFEEILIDIDLGKDLISFLRYPDLLRLRCTSRAIQQWMQKQETPPSSQNQSWRDLIRWLRDVEILIVLNCPRKEELARSLRKGDVRIYHSACNDGKVQYSSLFDLYADNTALLFGVDQNFEHFSANCDTLADAFGYPQNKDEARAADDEYEPQPREKRIKRGCCSFVCSQVNSPSIGRLFYVNDNAYCGKCIDRDVFLRILYVRYYGRSDWDPFEQECQNLDGDHDEFGTVMRREDEFSILLWEHFRETLERFWLLAKGDRHPAVEYGPAQLDREGNLVHGADDDCSE